MNQSKTVPILLTVIAVLFVSILVLLAVYLPKNQSTPVKIDVALAPTIAPTIKPIVVAQITTTTPTPTSSVPSDWKTYTNTKYKYSLKYPSNWYLGDQNGTVYINDSPIPDVPLTHGLPSALTIGIDMSQEIPNPPWKQSRSNITIDGIESLIIVDQEPDRSEGLMHTFIIINKPTNNYNYVISFINTNDRGTHNTVFDQILSTFKFTQ